jgi:hypothetical protein
MKRCSWYISRTKIQCYSEQDILTVLSSNNIVIGKLPASTTSTTQACDAGNIFKGIKANLKGHLDDIVERFGVHDQLEKLLRTHDTTFGGATAYHKKKLLIPGLIRIHHAIQKCVCASTVTNSFQEVGMYPLSFEKNLANCTTKLSKAEELFIRNKLPELVEAYSKDGQLTDSLMDKCGLPAHANRSSRGKECLATSNQRAVLLSHQETCARWRAIQEAKAKVVEARSKRKKNYEAISSNKSKK